MLIDPSAHELALWNFRDARQLFDGRSRVAFVRVFDSLEIEQAQVFAFFQMLVGLFTDVHRRPVRNDVCALEQAPCFRAAGLAVGAHALCFRVILARVQEHEEVLH